MSMLRWRDWMFYAAFFSDTSVANRVAYIRSNHRCRDCTSCHFQNIEEKPVQVITYQLNGGQFVLLKKCPPCTIALIDCFSLSQTSRNQTFINARTIISHLCQFEDVTHRILEVYHYHTGRMIRSKNCIAQSTHCVSGSKLTKLVVTSKFFVTLGGTSTILEFQVNAAIHKSVQEHGLVILSLTL